MNGPNQGSNKFRHLNCIQVQVDRTGNEPDWMTGSHNNIEGCFPEAYVQALADEPEAPNNEGFPSDGFASAFNETRPSKEKSKAFEQMGNIYDSLPR